MLKLYENIRQLRTARGMSQDELAQRVGYKDRTSIAKIEAGVVDLSQSKIMAFAKALGVDVVELMGIVTEEPTTKPITIAAHATEDLDADDIEEINRFIDYIKSRKKK